MTALKAPRSPVRPARRPTPLVLADFGSTYTKVTVVDERDGRLVATARHRTTIDSDVLDGLDGALATLEPAVRDIGKAPILACSSAGGGLKVAVVGLERDLTAEAARVAALSAGGRVDTVLAGRNLAMAQLETDPPDIILLTGGTDGGNAQALLAAAVTLAASRLDVPVVVAGNREVSLHAQQVLTSAGKRVASAANVMPEIGVLRCDEAREAIREQFLRHVIGGKHLSEGERFVKLVRMATPDAVLAGAEVAAGGAAGCPATGPLVVLDVGGATTDVHSVISCHQGADGMERPALPQAPVSRTVEGDLGLRWNAPGIVEAARGQGLIPANEVDAFERAARARASDPGLDASTAPDQAVDVRLAGWAARIALKRHCGRLAISLTAGGASIRREGRDLRDVPTLVATGGVFEHADSDRIRAALDDATVAEDGCLLPRALSLTIDRRYVMAAVGLLASEYPEQAARLFTDHVMRLDQAQRRPS